jgi:general secretion pathway protein N
MLRRIIIFAISLLLIAVLVLILAPAKWVTQAVRQASGGRVQPQEVHGLWWRGQMRVALADPSNERTQPTLLPGTLSWRLAGGTFFPPSPVLELTAPAMASSPIPITLTPQGLSGIKVAAPAWKAQLPLSVLEGLGAPWNTLGLAGLLYWQHEELLIESTTSATNFRGNGKLVASELQSSLSPLKPLGSYRLQWQGEPSGGLRFSLSSDQGPLLLEGNGQLLNGKARFDGTAQAAPGSEGALSSLLAVIGRREAGSAVTRIRVQ